MRHIHSKDGGGGVFFQAAARESMVTDASLERMRTRTTWMRWRRTLVARRKQKKRQRRRLLRPRAEIACFAWHGISNRQLQNALQEVFVAVCEACGVQIPVWMVDTVIQCCCNNCLEHGMSEACKLVMDF